MRTAVLLVLGTCFQAFQEVTAGLYPEGIQVNTISVPDLINVYKCSVNFYPNDPNTLPQQDYLRWWDWNTLRGYQRRPIGFLGLQKRAPIWLLSVHSYLAEKPKLSRQRINLLKYVRASGGIITMSHTASLPTRSLIRTRSISSTPRILDDSPFILRVIRREDFVWDQRQCATNHNIIRFSFCAIHQEHRHQHHYQHQHQQLPLCRLQSDAEKNRQNVRHGSPLRIVVGRPVRPSQQGNNGHIDTSVEA
jgi:hypothetical protein